jgi:hypothetical protein
LLPDRLSCPGRALGFFVLITRRNHPVAVVAQDLKYKSFLAAPNDVESDDFIIDLYPVDRNPLLCLFVDRLEIYLPLGPSSRTGMSFIISPLVGTLDSHG